MILATCVLLLLLSSCSSIIPRPADPECGNSIPLYAVLVLDVTTYNRREDLIDDAVRQRVGSYRIMTDEPLWIPRKNLSDVTGSAGRITDVQSISAGWGCNLLLLLDSRAARTGLTAQSGEEGVEWLVHAGRREAAP